MISRAAIRLPWVARLPSAAFSVRASDVRAVQEPLKSKYKSEPESALARMRAEAFIDNETMSVTVVQGPGQSLVRAGRSVTVSGLHPAAGGDGSEACSADMLLQSLVACAGVTFRAVWQALGMGTITSGRVIATGMMDFRGTLSVDRTASVGMTEVRLEFDIQSDEDPAAVKKAVALAERYCVIYQTLKNGVPALESEAIFDKE